MSASTIIKDVEGFFSTMEQSISGKITGATADVVKKTLAVAHVAEHLASVFATNVETTWAQLDSQTLAAVASSVTGLIHTGDYEQASLGLIYLVYQTSIEATNKAEAVLSGAVNVAAAATGTTSTVQAVEGAVESVWTEVKTEAEKVVDKVEGWYYSCNDCSSGSGGSPSKPYFVAASSNGSEPSQLIVTTETVPCISPNTSVVLNPSPSLTSKAWKWLRGL
jgi:hypothetical protein